jgi:integrase
MRRKRQPDCSKTYSVRRKLADGTERVYSYARKPKRRKSAYASDAVARIIDQWQNSPEWRNLKPHSVSVYKHCLKWLDRHRAVSIRSLSRGDLLAGRDGIVVAHGAASANNFLATVSALMKFALDRGIIQVHPLVKAGRLPIGEWHRWPEEAVTFALANFPPHLRRAVVLAIYTGQRSGDCCGMRWSDYDGQGIAVTQQKTGAKLWIPCHQDLKAELAQWPRDAVTILTNSYGRPYRVGAFQVKMHQEMRRHQGLTGLVFHGLRKSAAARLAEAGCTVLEIAAITGHSSLSMLQHYTKEADQRTRASAAIVKLEGAKRRNQG